MDKNATERCMVKAILSLINVDEGVVVKDDVTGNKYIISTGYPERDDMIRIEKITGNDDSVVQLLKEGEIVYLDK